MNRQAAGQQEVIIARQTLVMTSTVTETVENAAVRREKPTRTLTMYTMSTATKTVRNRRCITSALQDR